MADKRSSSESNEQPLWLSFTDPLMEKSKRESSGEYGGRNAKGDEVKYYLTKFEECDSALSKCLNHVVLKHLKMFSMKNTELKDWLSGFNLRRTSFLIPINITIKILRL